jgi:hypothetical protein
VMVPTGKVGTGDGNRTAHRCVSVAQYESWVRCEKLE